MLPCKLWQRALSTGYGVRCVKTGSGKWRNVYVHRVACEEAHGPPPFPGAVAMHSCDNPACYEPTHLSWGTQRDNINDSIAKGRMRKARGEAAGNTKLTEANVRYIRAQLTTGRTQQSIADEFGIYQSAIAAIKAKRSWAHLGDCP